jgi:hypothetical protein
MRFGIDIRGGVEAHMNLRTWGALPNRAS